MSIFNDHIDDADKILLREFDLSAAGNVLIHKSMYKDSQGNVFLVPAHDRYNYVDGEVALNEWLYNRTDKIKMIHGVTVTEFNTDAYYRLLAREVKYGFVRIHEFKGKTFYNDHDLEKLHDGYMLMLARKYRNKQ